MTAYPPGSLPGEDWRDVVGYVGIYQVSSFGRVYSVPRKWQPAGAYRTLTLTDYLRVTLWDNQGGRKRKNVPVHNLVMAAFVGPRPDGLDVCHNDTDELNCRLDNLRYDTRSNNNRDRLKVTRPDTCKYGHDATLHGYLKRGAFQCRECDRIAARARYAARKTHT